LWHRLSAIGVGEAVMVGWTIVAVMLFVPMLVFLGPLLTLICIGLDHLEDENERGVTPIADSAASLGSLYQGRPIDAQANAHAFSMSFAKLLSAGGAGRAVVLRAAAPRERHATSALMGELHAVAAPDQLDALVDLVASRAGIGATGDHHSYVHRVMRTPNRAVLANRLGRVGVETKEYFRAIYLPSATTSSAMQLPVTAALDDQVLPTSSELTLPKKLPSRSRPRQPDGQAPLRAMEKR
jgi:hypothetical protein